MYSTQRVMKVVVVIKESSLVDASKHMVLMCSVGIAVKGNWVGLISLHALHVCYKTVDCSILSTFSIFVM